MLYFKVIYQGVACIPQIPPAIRAELAKNLEEQGWDKLQADLAKVDLVGANRIQKNDKQRLLRALEVYHATGKTLDYWWQQSPTAGLADDNQIIQIALIPANRQQLYTQINKRFDLMLKQGLLCEVAGLLDKYKLSIKHNSMRSVGYRQVLGYLAGELSHEQMQQQATRATRNLAKRQLTWLRNWHHPLLRVSLTSYEATLAELSKIILHKLS